MTDAPEQRRFYTEFVDASNFERLALSVEGPVPIRIEQAGVYAGGIAADGTVSFDWPVLQKMAAVPSNEVANVIARLLIAAREAGRKETQ